MLNSRTVAIILHDILAAIFAWLAAYLAALQSGDASRVSGGGAVHAYLGGAAAGCGVLALRPVSRPLALCQPARSQAHPASCWTGGVADSIGAALVSRQYRGATFGADPRPAAAGGPDGRQPPGLRAWKERRLSSVLHPDSKPVLVAGAGTVGGGSAA